jgi:glycosyltransferase involved in cell wall biosynthesis
VELPRVVHLFDPSTWASGRAGQVLSANGRSLALVLGTGSRPDGLPPLSRYLKLPMSSRVVTAGAVRTAGGRLVHAHDASQVGSARVLAAAARLPWAVTVTVMPAETSAPDLTGAAFVVVPDEGARAWVIECGVAPDRVVAHRLGDLPEPGALMAVLEAHWVSVLATGRPAELAAPTRDLPTVTVLLATYQRRELLRRCLEHLEEQTYPRHLVQVVVVDNGSTDGTADDLRVLEERGRLTVVTTGEALLVTEARNRALAAATGELVVFTDDDCRAVPAWLENLVSAWLVAGRGIVQGRTTGDPRQPREPSSRTQETPFGFGLFETCNIGYPRAALGLRPFDDGIPMRLREILGKKFPRDPTGEDTDLGWRLRERGLAFCFSSTALVHHEIFEPDPAYVLRRARMTAVFPVLVERHPQLRRSFLVGRVFLHKQRPAWWLAALAPAAAAAWGPPAALMAVPYGWALVQPHQPGVRSRVRALPVTLRVDALTSVALLRGTLRTGRLVL